jgi:aspartate aminotransferase-like enzyme
MDNGNNQLNPHNSQNRQSNNALDHILQTGVTPEQYAQNARQLETYSRMNALGLQVYLQRQSHLAEQRRRDE